MATQCRSSKCTAERKGFRRELDSWRHKLIHCVGFESILEGIYGPRLLKDLSIFDDCEPEVSNDWSLDANCSFCNLQLEKLSDHNPTVASPQSPSSAETPPPQGQSNAGKLQCQADQFLNAVFRKKELSQSCDSNIPHVARELMKKMIKQFALEYASKSHDSKNNVCDDHEDPECCGLPKCPDEDMPLDLTVSRNHLEADYADGVLDLSRKKTVGSASTNAFSQKTVGSLESSGSNQVQEVESEDTVLRCVLSCLCLYHKQLLFNILMCAREDYLMSVALRDAQRRMAASQPLCVKKQCEEVPCGTCCLHSCRVTACPSISLCLKNLHSLSCQSITLSCINKACPASAICYTHHKTLPCAYHSCANHSYITHVRGVGNVPLVPQNVSKSRCSPSPPPLSPIPVENDLKVTGSSTSCCAQDNKPLCILPPSLVPHEKEGKDMRVDIFNQTDVCTEESKQKAGLKSEPQEMCEQNGSLGDLMNRFTEKLKCVTPPEVEQTLFLPPSPDCKDDVHLKEIITTVLHSGSDNDYNLNELFQQHESKSPQTRSRSRQVARAAMTDSPDQPSARRQNLQIKRDLARLHPPKCRKRLNMKRSMCARSSELEQISVCSETEFTENSEMDVEEDHLDHLNFAIKDAKMHENTTKSHNSNNEIKEECEIMVAEPSEAGDEVNTSKDSKYLRSKRNIVPPQRFSLYVTEPKKMYLYSCTSENILNRKSQKVNVLNEVSSSTGRPFSSLDVNSHDTFVCKCSLDTPLCEEPTCSHFPPTNQFNESDILKRLHTDSEKKNEQSCPCPMEKSPFTQSQVIDLPTGSSFDSNLDASAESIPDTKEDQPRISYTSPIKLMYVSTVVSEQGLKYNLKSAAFGLSHVEAFDPCEAPSWEGPSEVTNTQDSIFTTPSKVGQCGRDKNTSPKHLSPPDGPRFTGSLDNENPASPSLIRESSPLKRRPGRPKKLGPQMQKPAKRPIGRPPKNKTASSNSATVTGDTSTSKDNNSDISTKNLKITVVYGRSRRTRRLVSEDNNHTNSEENINEGGCGHLNHNHHLKMETTLKENVEETPPHPDLPKDNSENFHFVRPVKEKKALTHASGKIKCQKQTGIMTIRKPGRPPKVKISGISVTVTTVSPRQRKIHVNRDMKESPPSKRSLITEYNPPKEPKTIRTQEDICKEMTNDNQRNSELKVRFSVREKKPSIHLLHSVATSRSIRHSSALLRRSRKLLLNKASSGSRGDEKPQGTSGKALSKHTAKNVKSIQHIGHFSRISVESIFTSNAPFRWWPISASSETLNEELSKRIKLMSNTWVPSAIETSKLNLIENGGGPKPELNEKGNGSSRRTASAVRMLFEKHCDMDKLGAWFMQTTETQSLAIVKKASTRNPYEIVQYNPVMSASRVNVCPSTQAERLKKHAKKFAMIVPKSPIMHQKAQKMMCNIRRLRAKRCLQRHPAHAVGGLRRLLEAKGDPWGRYRAILHRVRSKFTTTHKIVTAQDLIKQKTAFNTGTQKDRDLCFLEESNLSHNAGWDFLPSLKHDHTTNLSDEQFGTTNISREVRISSKAWSPESLKECRVFLKKINSPNNELTAEECNICTVELCDVLPSKYSTEADYKDEAKKAARTTSYSQTPSSPQKGQDVGRGRGQKRKRHRGSTSLPEKRARQSRSCRGLSAKKWCDFVMGSIK
ncbi:uncharacterized protein lcorl isoform X2 [Denticeps clupeoides]|uniref:uncharacterized protein lcorl isoform X2 n=1 Tax=Denticeps clupeoides TaxID=299321 RepID=UPI0010A3949E|nr:uncharacterized protein LOC114788316 isoform X2 [Denticeps clupeoides]